MHLPCEQRLAGAAFAGEQYSTLGGSRLLRTLKQASHDRTPRLQEYAILGGVADSPTSGPVPLEVYGLLYEPLNPLRRPELRYKVNVIMAIR